MLKSRRYPTTDAHALACDSSLEADARKGLSMRAPSLERPPDTDSRRMRPILLFASVLRAASRLYFQGPERAFLPAYVRICMIGPVPTQTDSRSIELL